MAATVLEKHGIQPTTLRIEGKNTRLPGGDVPTFHVEIKWTDEKQLLWIGHAVGFTVSHALLVAITISAQGV